MIVKMLSRIARTPWLALAITLFISIVFFSIMRQHSRMETNLDKYMPEKHPAFIYSAQAEEWFNIKDGIIIAIESPGGIYNQSTLKKIKDLTIALQNRTEIKENDVTSLFTADNIVASEGGMEVESFYNEIPTEKQDLDALQKAVRLNEMVHGRLVSEDGTVALVIARIGDDVFSQKFYQDILAIAEKYQEPEKIYVAGRPIVEGTMALLGPKDMKRMVPVVVAVITLVLFIVLRSFSATIATLLIVLISTIWTFGLMAALRIPVYAVSTMIPVMLIAIGVADGIHLYNHLRHYIRNYPEASKISAITELVQSMWKPVVMTSVTTAVGFASLLTSSVYPIKYFGVFTAFGVLMAMIFSLVIIPAFISIFGLPKVNPHKVSDGTTPGKFAEIFTRQLVKKQYLTLFTTIAIIAVSIFGITRVWINSSFLDKFESDSDIVRTDSFINKYFGGTSTLNVVLESSANDAFKQPTILRIIDRMQNYAEAIDGVGNSFSLTDYLRRMNRVMHADSAAYETIPESQELVAQYILLYEMSGDPDNLLQLVDYNYKRANVTLQLKGDDSKTIKSAMNIVETFRPELLQNGITVNYAGSGYKSLVFTDLILYGQISSLLLSLVIVFVLISVMFRSIRLGLIGSVPIALTAVISFGVMGLSNVALSTTTALLSSIAIGIGIDYAIHFIDRFRHYRSKISDIDKVSAMTMNSTGKAILFNAVVVITGFLVLLFSVFPPNRMLGILISLNMTIALIGTVTVMYLLLRWQAKRIWK